MLIDAHCHLDFPQLNATPEILAATLQAAKAAGVGGFVVAATQASSWQRLLKLTANQPNCFANVGLHPWCIAEHQPEDLQQLEALLKKALLKKALLRKALLKEAFTKKEGLIESPSKIIALGEIGLDFSTPELKSTIQQQESYFLAQVEIAQSLKLPLVIHHHKSLERILQLLKQTNFSNGGLIHGFSGSDEQAKTALNLGFKLGLGLNLLFHRAKRLQRQVIELPLTSWLLETDSPSLKPHPALSSTENPVISTPAHLLLVAEKFAQLTGLTLAQVEQHTFTHLLAIFPLAKPYLANSQLAT